MLTVAGGALLVPIHESSVIRGMRMYCLSAHNNASGGHLLT